MGNVSEGNIPEQEKGFSSDTVHACDTASVEKAMKLYDEAKSRLLDVNHWNIWSTGVTSRFTLTDANGRKILRQAQEGDFFRIDIPGPGPEAGEGYDWVAIEKIEEEKHTDQDSETLVMQVRPSPGPESNDRSPAHFFEEDASSSFRVTRAGRKVVAAVHGRNETPNNKTESVADNVRNAFVALGAAAGFSKMQWKNLVKGIIEYKGL